MLDRRTLPALKKCGLSRISIMLATLALFSGSAAADKPTFNGPVNVIFDTDMCGDVDDAMALALVYALHDRHEANLLAITVGLDENWCAPFVDLLNIFYGHPEIPVGTIRNGLGYRKHVRKIYEGMGWPYPEKRPPESFVPLILKRKNSDGSPVYPRHLRNGSEAPEAVALLRRTLANQPDESVVMIQVGYSSNFAALLDSRSDEVSDHRGLDLIKKKVRFLSVMAGTFKAQSPEELSDTHTGINVYQDVLSARKIFNRWPTPIVIGGTEIGGTISFPAISIERDFSYVSNHPIAESYGYTCQELLLRGFIREKCLHDHHTADLAAALYALRPDRNYFSLSKPGRITVLSSGDLRFHEEISGNHRLLVASEEQKIRAQEAMMMLVSQLPAGYKH